MSDASQVQEHMDVISADLKTVGKVDHLDGPDKIKLTKQSSPNGEHHHFIPVSWIDHVDQHVHLNKTGADVTAHWSTKDESRLVAARSEGPGFISIATGPRRRASARKNGGGRHD